MFVYQYPLFLKGRWNTVTFIFSYCILIVVSPFYLGWKVWKKTKVRMTNALPMLTSDLSIFADCSTEGNAIL